MLKMYIRGRFWASLSLLVALNAHAACHSGDLDVVVLGSGGPELVNNRAASSYLVRDKGEGIFLVDTGSGSAINFEKAGGKLSDIRAVLFTHLHTDHSADFPAYIKKTYFDGRDRNLPVFGPDGNSVFPDLKSWLYRLFGKKEGAYSYLSDYLEGSRDDFKIIPTVISADYKQAKLFHQNIDGYDIYAMPVSHGIVPALAWKIQKGECSITFSGDTSNQKNMLNKLAKNTDVLVIHNAIPESAGEAARGLHVAPSQIGMIAKDANPGKLILSHIMRRTEDKKDETRKVISGFYHGDVHFAVDLDVYKLCCANKQ